MEMPDNNKPQRKDELSAASDQSLKLSQKVIAVQVHLTTLNSKSEPDSELTREFLRVFWNEPPSALEWAFRKWREESPYFPAISELRKLLDGWHRNQREQEEGEALRREKEAVEQARSEGNVVEFANLVKDLREILDAQGEPEHERRLREFNERMLHAGLATVTLHLTPDEIAARREKELEEIRKYGN
jgi:hypothetical protein